MRASLILIQCRRYCARILAGFFAVGGLLAAPATASESIVLASTTSTQASGLYEYLLPQFTADTGITVHVVAVGTGRAIQLASRGDADVLLVHHRPSEEQFIADGFGIKRHDLMHNDFILIGSPSRANFDASMSGVQAWLRFIFEHQNLFVSRGDDSGTHKKEQALWQLAGLDPMPFSGQWYRQTGAGMGATLNTAAALDAITLTDRATWLNFKNRGNLKILAEGDSMLNNPYSVILVNPEKFPHVNAKAGQKFINWLLSEKGQNAIATYRVNGEPLFFPLSQAQQ